MYKLWCLLNFKWCMVNAYLTQDHSPMACAQWLNDADNWNMELWRIERGMVE